MAKFFTSAESRAAPPMGAEKNSQRTTRLGSWRRKSFKTPKNAQTIRAKWGCPHSTQGVESRNGIWIQKIVYGLVQSHGVPPSHYYRMVSRYHHLWTNPSGDLLQGNYPAEIGVPNIENGSFVIVSPIQRFSGWDVGQCWGSRSQLFRTFGLTALQWQSQSITNSLGTHT